MNEEDRDDSEDELDEESADSIVRFDVSISTDRDHFLRRTCSGISDRIVNAS